MSRIQAPAAVEKHSIPPFFGSDSQILILGSFPSVKSRESGFYYGHPQNRFWRVLSSVFNAPLPQTIEQKQEFLLHSLYRALGCRRRMQHTRFGGQQYFGRHRKRYCSAPPFDANQSRFFKRSNGTKAFSQISFRRNRKIRLHRHGAAFNKPRKRIIFTRKACCRMGQRNPRRPCDLRIGVNVRNFACILKVYPKFLSNCEFQRL